MLTKINTGTEDFLTIVDLYYEKENFNINIEIFKRLTLIYDEIKKNVDIYSKIFPLEERKEDVLYRVELDCIKIEFPDEFDLLVKFLRTFCEETISFLKILLHLEGILSNSGETTDPFNVNLNKNKKVNLYFSSNEIFHINSTSDLKINTYIEFNAYIRGVSCLKTINTKVKISCSVCGPLFTKNIMRVHSNKMYNSFILNNNDKKIHQCESLNLEENSSSSNKILREFCDPMIIRYISADIIPTKSENRNHHSSVNNLKTLCICNESLISNFPIWENMKISGIVKTRPEANTTGSNNNNKDNFFEKIIEITHIEKIDNLFNYDSEINRMNSLSISNNINFSENTYPRNLPYSHEEIFKFQKLSSFSNLSTFFILNLINPKISSNFDFMNFLSYYYILSGKESLKIHIIDQTKTDLFKHSLLSLKELSESIIYHDFNTDPKSNDEFVISKETNKNLSQDFVLKFGKIFSSHDKFLILDNLPSNINQTLLTFLSLNMISPSVNIISSLTEDSNSFISGEFKSFSSLLSTSKVTDFSAPSCNLSQIIQQCDFIAFYSDRIDSERDRRKTNLIIENQFNTRKRKFSDLSNEPSQRSQLNNNNISNNNISQFTQFNPNSKFNLMNGEDLYALDTKSFPEFYKKVIKEDLDQIKKIAFLNEYGTREKSFLMKYIKFINDFISPKLSTSSSEIIQHLSLHLIKSFSDLNSFELMNFDMNGNNIKRILTKISILNARVNMKEIVDTDDILQAYIFTKEIVQQNFIFCLNNRTQNVNKNKKNKISFVIEKIKAICAINSRRTFTKSEITEACEYANIHDDLDKLIETLNFNGFMIKLSGDEYQLCN